LSNLYLTEMPVTIYVLSSIVLNLCGNILIKKGAIQGERIFLNYNTVAGYFIFVLVVLLNFKLIMLIKLIQFSILISVNYLLTYLAGIVVFKENFSHSSLVGIFLVCLGLVCFRMS